LFAGLEGRDFVRRVTALTAVGMLWFFVGAGINQSLLPAMTSPSSLAFTTAWTLAAAWVAWRVWAGRGPRVGGGDVPLGGMAVAVLSTAAVALLMALPSLLADRQRPEAPSEAAAGPKRPNVVLIVLDTVRADHLSVYGYAKP